MKTIETRVLPATNRKGKRIVATDCGDHRVVVDCDGHTKDGMVFVFANDERFTILDDKGFEAIS